MAVGEVDGQSTLVKYYKGNSKNDAIKVSPLCCESCLESDENRRGCTMSKICKTCCQFDDIIRNKQYILTTHSHPNIPHMTGYSDEDSPTPFILLSDGMRSCCIFSVTVLNAPMN